MYTQRTLHLPSMRIFCVAELEIDVMEEFGYFSARNRVSDPHPHPRSTIFDGPPAGDHGENIFF